jgi:prophage DNA circulation protein
MRWTVLALAISLLGCGTTARLRQRLDWLVELRATASQLVAEYGEPVSRRAAPDDLEFVEFVYGTRSSSRTVARVADGVATSETITTTVPGKLRIVAQLRQGKLVSYELVPNR